MLRSFLGLQPSVKKRTAESIKEKQQCYDNNKRCRKIVHSWKEEFQPWLVCDDTNQKVYCTVCRSVYGPLATRKVPDRFKRYSTGPFVCGSSNLRHDSFEKHQKSDGHIQAELFSKAKSTAPGQSVAEKSLQMLNEASFKRLEKLFRISHSLAKKSRPISDFQWICILEEMNGSDIGPTYRNRESCKAFMVAIADVERKKIEEALSKAKFCTLMSDGSTDVSVCENEIVYVHFAFRGITYCYFLGLIECETADAKGIFAAIMKALKFSNLSEDDVREKIIAFAGDGASVNTGKLNGVIALFRRHVSPSIVMVQCMSHRIELAYKDAMKKAPLYKKVYNLLDELFKFYHASRSAKQKSGLKVVFGDLDIPQSLPTRVGGTRWVGHIQTALRSLWKGYRAFHAHLKQVASVSSKSSGVQSKAKFQLNLLRSLDVVTFGHFLTDVVVILSRLSMALQKRKTCIYEIHQELETAKSNLMKFENRTGPELRKLQEGKGIFQGETLVAHSQDCHAQRAKVIQALLQSMTGRFSDINDGVLQSTRIADLATWPASLDEAADFGDDHLAALVDHYRNHLLFHGVDISAVEAEWTILKTTLYNSSHKVHTLAWATINDLYFDKFPNILEVVDLILSLPAGTSECERGFSQMNIIKNKYRNKLKSSSVTLLMTIQLHSPEIEQFDPAPAIHLWNSSRRRPDFLQRKQRNKMSVVEILEQATAEAEAEAEAEHQGDNVALEVKDRADSDYDSDFSDMESCESGTDDDDDISD